MMKKEKGRTSAISSSVKSKSAVQRNFDRAAATYDRFADVQSEVAQHLVGLLSAAYFRWPSRIIELGCGTGSMTCILQRKYPSSSLIAVDFAAEMLKRAATRLEGEKVDFFCRDIMEFLTMQKEPVDLVVSNATLQWIDELEPVVALTRSLLREHGLFVFSAFGPESLVELQEGLDAVLPGRASLAARSFKDGDLINELLRRHFTGVEKKAMTVKREYADVASLFKQIRNTGTSGAHRTPLRFSRDHLKEMDSWFEKRYGGCRVSYQVMLFRCRP